MKRLLLVFVVLALAMLACQPNGPTPEPVVIVVTATTAPMKVAPTAAPAPAAKYDATGLPSVAIEWLEDEGFKFSGQQVTGVQSCGASTCTHWGKDTIAASFYVNRGELTGLLVSFDEDELGAYTGEVAGYVFASSGVVPDDALEAVSTLISQGGGSIDNPSGWRTVVGKREGRYFIMVTIPGRNVGSASGQSASA